MEYKLIDASRGVIPQFRTIVILPMYYCYYYYLALPASVWFNDGRFTKGMEENRNLGSMLHIRVPGKVEFSSGTGAWFGSGERVWMFSGLSECDTLWNGKPKTENSAMPVTVR